MGYERIGSRKSSGLLTNKKSGLFKYSAFVARDANLKQELTGGSEGNGEL